MYCNELFAVQARAKRKVVKLVLVVITTFVVCWSPHQVTRQCAQHPVVDR